MVLLRKGYSLAQGRTREMSQSEFARHCGIGIQAWHNIENAHNRIGLDNAIRLRLRVGVSLEFIYFDSHRNQLPQALLAAIEEIERLDKSKPKRA